MGRRRIDENKSTCNGAAAEAPGFFTPVQAGELPLFYVTSPKLARSRAVSRIRKIGTTPQASLVSTRREVNADVHLCEAGDGGSGHIHSQEIATWASSYRFDLDAQDAVRLQAMLERDALSSEKNLTDSRNWTESPHTSFRFPIGTEEEEEEEEPSGLFLQAIPGSIRFVATASGNGSECGEPARGCSLDVVPVHSVAVDVPNSPEREEVLRRLEKLKTASLLRFGGPSVDNVVTYHKEIAKSAARRQHLHQTQMTDSCKTSTGRSFIAVSNKNMAPRQVQEMTTTLGERIRLNQSNSSPSGEAQPTKQSPRRSSSTHSDQIVTVCRLEFPASCKVSKVSSPDHTPFLSAARGRIPFKWEEEPGKPKTIPLNALRGSPEDAERSTTSETTAQLQNSSQEADEKIVPEVSGNDRTSSGRRSCSLDGASVGNADGVESHRYYGLRAHSESSMEQSSRRYGSHERRETQIDLDASAAARFLVEVYDTPVSTPGRHSSSSLVFAVPFEWEDAPGKAKVETQEERRANSLQLPPRLAVASCKNVESFSRGSHPGFAGLFAPCLTASTSPGHHSERVKQCSDHRGLVWYGSSKSLPPRVPTSPRKRTGLVGRCYSSPQEGCHIRAVSKSPVLQSVSKDAAPSSPRSILCGPDESSSSSSQISASNVFSSGDLESFTQETNHESSRQFASKSSTSNSSFESIEENFCISPPSFPLQPPNAKKGSLLNLTDKSTSQQQQQQQQQQPQCPEPTANWSPALTNYFQSLHAAATSTSTTASAGDSPARGEVARPWKGELPLPGIQTQVEHQEFSSRPASSSSPKRPTRLPYTMPSPADQLRAGGESLTRRQPSPVGLRKSSARRRSSRGRTWGGTTSAPPRVERYHADEVCQTSPAYAAALQLLSPQAVSVVTQRQRKGLSKLPLTRPRRRARFMISICKSLKRLVLGRQRRCKAIEPKLMYDYSISPSAFQFYQPN